MICCFFPLQYCSTKHFFERLHWLIDCVSSWIYEFCFLGLFLSVLFLADQHSLGAFVWIVVSSSHQRLSFKDLSGIFHFTGQNWCMFAVCLRTKKKTRYEYWVSSCLLEFSCNIPCQHPNTFFCLKAPCPGFLLAARHMTSRPVNPFLLSLFLSLSHSLAHWLTRPYKWDVRMGQLWVHYCKSFILIIVALQKLGHSRRWKWCITHVQAVCMHERKGRKVKWSWQK